MSKTFTREQPLTLSLPPRGRGHRDIPLLVALGRRRNCLERRRYLGEPGREERPLARIVRERQRSTVFRSRLGETAEPAQEVRTGRGQEVILAERDHVD